MVDSAPMDWAPLIEAAHRSRNNAHAPYSGFKVGAAVRTAEGKIHAGCNVENRSFGSTLCAERAAVAASVAAGSGKLSAVAVVTDAVPPAPPCGLCLQVLSEFAHADLPILLTNLAGDRQLYTLGDLHPHPFELPAQGLGKQQES